MCFKHDSQAFISSSNPLKWQHKYKSLTDHPELVFKHQGCNQLLGIITRPAAWLQTAMLCWHKNWCMTPLTSWNFPESHWSCATKTSQTCHCCSQKIFSWQWYFVTKIDLVWEKIVLVIEKNFGNSKLAKFLRSLEQFIQTEKV